MNMSMIAYTFLFKGSYKLWHQILIVTIMEVIFIAIYLSCGGASEKIFNLWCTLATIIIATYYAFEIKTQ